MLARRLHRDGANFFLEATQMVSQPAYLANLKSLGRRRWATDEEAAEDAGSLQFESDRGAIILSATTLEDMLE